VSDWAIVLLTIAQAAERLAVCPKQIRRLIATGQLPAIRLGKSAKSDRILPQDLEGVVKKCRYIAVAPDGGSWSNIEVNALGKVLDRALPKRTRSASKRKSSADFEVRWSQ